MSQVDGRTRQIGQTSTILPPRGLCDGICRRWARPGAPRSRTLPCPPCPACAIEHRDGSTPGRTARRVRGLVQRSAALPFFLSLASNQLVRLALPQAGGEARERSRRELASPWPLSAARGRQPSPRSASFEPAPGPACPAGHPALRPQERTRTAAASRRLPRPRAGEPAARSCPAGVQARGEPPACQHGATMGARCSAAAGAARRAVAGGTEMCSGSRRRSTQRERQSGHRRDAPSDAAGNGRGAPMRLTWGGRGEWTGTKGGKGWRGELWRACAVCGPYVSQRRGKGRGASAVATWLVPKPPRAACCADAMLGSSNRYFCIKCVRFGCKGIKQKLNARSEVFRSPGKCRSAPPAPRYVLKPPNTERLRAPTGARVASRSHRGVG